MDGDIRTASKSVSLLLLIVLMVVFEFVLSIEDNSERLDEKFQDQKIFVHPITFQTNYTHYVIKPTASTVEFKPGVPPSWTHTVLIPRNGTKAYDSELIRDRVENVVMNTSVESQPLMIFNMTNPNQPNKNVFEWLLGIVGWKPEQNKPDQGPSNVQPPKHCKPCVCGMTYKNKRIVGGIETHVNEYPWMTALMYNNRFYCGASLINNKYLLTAGHCVNGFSKDRLSAVFLDHDRSNSFETQTFSRKISRIYRHNLYGMGGNYNNDIAILQLDQEIVIEGLINPVCLPPTGRSFTGYTGIATGWGATEEHGQVSSKLREVHVPIISNNDCKKTGYYNRITDNMMCAGYPNGMKDSCQGDSGGPLHIVNGSKNILVGIVSWGEGCAQPNYPGVYTRVNRYVSWIKANTRDACYC